MSLPRYAEYKDSGVAWLGDIPADWLITKTKHTCEFSTGWTPPTGDSSAYEGDNLWVNISDLGPKVLGDTAKRISDKAAGEAGIKVSPVGSLLFSFKLSVGQVSIAGAEMYTNEAIATFRASSRLVIGYAYYAFPIFLIKNASENIYGAKLLNQELIRSSFLPLPNVGEQSAIAAFLDRETGKIDALIAEQEKLLTLLAEKRQATISHAVTRGLNPNAPMKDSGVPWLGEVPAHWKVVPLRWYSQCKSGDGISGSDIESSANPEFQIPAIGGNGRMGFTSAGNIDQSVIAIGRVGALCGNVHVVRPPAWISDNALVLTPTDAFFLDYLAHALRCRNLNDIASKTAQPLITGTQVSDQRVQLPPQIEQMSIVAFINKEIGSFDLLKDAAVHAITLLKERRSALIAAAVTGKIDVRETA